MGHLNQTYRLFPQGESPFSDIFQIKLTEKFVKNKMIDYLSIRIDQSRVLAVFLFENEGVAICNLGDSLQYLIKGETQPDVFYCNSTNTQLIAFDHVLSLHYNPEDSHHGMYRFYVTLTFPAGVLEIDMSDTYNIFTQKIYVVNDINSKYVGRKALASNSQYIVHLMEDFISQKQIIRVYSRFSNYFDVAKADYPLPSYSRTNFFTFPNYFLNILWFRDEVNVNITAIFDAALVLNGTNASRIAQYQDQKFTVNLTVQNSFKSFDKTFSLKFVPSNDTSIELSQADNSNSIDLFYSCGDDEFGFDVSDFINGPYFSLRQDKEVKNQCKKNECYFKLENKSFQQTLNYNLSDLATCNKTFILPAQFEDGSADNGKMIFICINLNKRVIGTYKIELEDNSVTFLNEFKIHEVQFESILFDQLDRQLIVVTRAKRNPWIRAERQYEVHFFKILHTLIWESYQDENLDDFKLDNLSQMTYTELDNRGIAIGNISSIEHIGNSTIYMQRICYFKANFTDLTLKNILSRNIIIPTFEERIIKSVVSNINFMFFLLSNGIVEVYEVYRYFNSQYSSKQSFEYSYQKVNRYQFTHIESKHILDFDIFDSKYFVVYAGDREMVVFKITMQIYLQFKMKLPLYQQYSYFQFIRKPDNQPLIPIQFGNDFLTIMMTGQIKDKEEYHLFVYNLAKSQHSTFTFTYNITDLFQDSQSFNMMLYDKNYFESSLTLSSDFQIRIYDIQYTSYLTYKDDISSRKQLNDKCKNVKDNLDDRFGNQDNDQFLSEIDLIPVSLFREKEDLEEYGNESLTINIFSQNQGIVITPYDSIRQKFAYSDDQRKDDQNATLLLEEIIEGFNLEFNVSCSFMDENNIPQSCKDQLKVTYKNQFYQYYIDFVTLSRFIKQQFTIDGYYFMFDSQYYLNILKLPRNSKNLRETNDQPLEVIARYDQKSLLGCEVTGYVTYFSIKDYDPDPFDDGNYNLYVLAYQCKEGEVDNVLKFSLLKIYFPSVNFEKENQCINITKFEGRYDVKNKINDMIQVGFKFGDTHYFQFRLALSTEHQFSFTNLLLITDFYLRKETKTLSLKIKYVDQAITANMDTFKITKLLRFNESYTIGIVSQNFGLIFFDCAALKILGKLDVKIYNDFYYQDYSNYGEVRVYQAIGDWPYSLHLITNHGLFLFYFNGNLLSDPEATLDYEDKLNPTETKVVRMFFDQQDYQISQNSYGYAFLQNIFIDEQNFDVFLYVVSFYSSMQSRVFKSEKIASNIDCGNILSQTDLTDSREDTMVVSFICGSQMIIVRICIRPRITFHFDQIEETGSRFNTDGEFETSVSQFNNYSVQIEVTNTYTIEDLNRETFYLTVEYKSDSDYFTFVYSSLFTIIGMAISYFAIMRYGLFQNQQSDKKEEDEDKADYVRKESSMSLNLNENSFRRDSISVYLDSEGTAKFPKIDLSRKGTKREVNYQQLKKDLGYTQSQLQVEIVDDVNYMTRYSINKPAIEKRRHTHFSKSKNLEEEDDQGYSLKRNEPVLKEAQPGQLVFRIFDNNQRKKTVQR